MLGMSYGLSGNSSNKAVGNLMAGNTIDISTLNSAAMQGGGINLFGPVGSAIASRSAFDLTSAVPTTTFDMFHPSQLTINNNCLTLPTTTATTELLTEMTNNATEIKKIDIEVPDEIVTNILGPAGRSLLELQYRSGAMIQISKKGSYSSSTSSRVVTISGTASAVAAAQLLIEYQITETDLKKRRSNVNAIE